MDRASAEALLRKAVGERHAVFHPDQWEAIDAVANRRKKLLVVQRTGWGKSSVYFIATRILRDRGAGPTVIISPLLALMRNQIAAAERLGIRAATVNSSNQDDWDEIRDAILAGRVDAVLISPERLSNDDFLDRILARIADRVGLLVVDEAHCISDWGHDFRPDYRRIVNVLRQMPPNMPVLATTATANNRVVEDIRTQLGRIEALRGPLVRQSLALQAIRLEDQAARLAWLAEQLPRLPGTGIVYTLTKWDADQVAGWLRRNRFDAAAYYSDATHPDFPDSDAYRRDLEQRLLDNRVKAVVATSALGMGFDKPDLGFVIHYQAPSSVVAYYQQVGRAGRAIPHARGVLLAGGEDEDIQEYFRRKAFPEEGHIDALLSALEEADGLSVTALEERLNLSHGQIEQVLKFLRVENPAPVMKLGSRWYRTAADFHMDHERIRFLTQRREREWAELQRYIDHHGCLMAFLRNALDDPDPTPCGKCANCAPATALPATVGHETGVQAAVYLRHTELNIKPKARIPRGALSAYGLLGDLKRRGLSAEPGRVLARWGDAGWGRLVAAGKHGGRFDDLIVGAVVEMVRERWQPQPAPRWLTCVPSLTHPDLVPDFARRLAAALRVPFVAAVAKVKQNEPQKLMSNAVHQCRNLDGVFQVSGPFPPGPVLLVDDVVDSGWTLAVVAALLRQAGAGAVYPLALATTAPG